MASSPGLLLQRFQVVYPAKRKSPSFKDGPFDFFLPSGESLAILGPSGSGKSTFLKGIVGLLESEGDVLLDGRPLLNDEVSYLGEEALLYPQLTLFDNLAFPLKNAHLDFDEIRRRVNQIALDFSMADLLSRKPRQLSRGQQTMAALAKAVLKGSSYLLLDEPFNALDGGKQAFFASYLAQMKREAGVSFLFVAHEEKEVLGLCEKKLVIVAGKPLFYGPFESEVPSL
jgi:ABC-type sugar transport system ATPase subunit